MADTIILLLIENSIVFGLLFGGVCLIKRIFRKGMSVRLHFLIWAVVIIKLLVPFSVTMPWSPGAVLSNTVLQTPRETVQTNNATAADTKLPIAAQPAAPAIEQNSDAQAQPVSAYPAKFDWAAFAFIVWIAGIVIYIVWLWLKWLQLQKAIHRSGIAVPGHIRQTFLSCKQAVGIRKNVRLMVQNVLHVPAATGLIHPIVLIPTDFHAIQIEHVFMHELAHIKRGDIAVVWGLNILRALYWFHPLVWMCFKLIQRDMEADCDGMAVKVLGPKKLSGYIETILYFSGKDRPATLQAAMSLNDGCTRMKKRIRSMFMDKRTKGPVKIAIVCLAAAMTFAAFTSGCGTVSTQAAPEYKMTMEQWTDDDIELENVSIRIDAQVVKPDKETFNIYETHRAGFPQEQINKTLRFFYGNNTLYNFGGGTNREAGEKRLENLQKQFDQFALPALEEEIEWIKSDLALRPENEDMVISNGQLVNGRLDVWVDLGDGRQGSVRVVNDIDDTGANPSIQINAGNGDYYSPYPPYNRQADGIALTPDEALSKVQEMLHAMRLDNIKPRYVLACNVVSDVSGEFITKLPGAYDVICVPSVDGMDAGYVHEMNNADGNEVYTKETINVFVNDSGIVKIEWLNHWENGKATEDVTLLPLDDIKQTFKEKMVQRYQDTPQKMEQTVDQVVMELARVNAGDEWRLVPVWCFYGISTFLDEDDVVVSTQPNAMLLCINALDGTVIE